MSGYNKTSVFFKILMLCVIFTDLVIFSLTVFSHGIYFKIILSAAALIALLLFFKNYLILFFRKKIRLDDFSKKKLGRFKTEEIRNEINILFDEFRKSGNEIPEIFILPNSLESPHVIDIYLLNFMKTLNAVYIPEYIFHFMTADEIRCIIAHETAHFYKYILPAARFTLPFYLLITAAASFFMISYPEHILFFSLTAVFAVCFTDKLLFGTKSQTQEYLSDAYAADKYGKLNMINALLVLEHISEICISVYKVLLPAIESDENLSLRHSSKIMPYIITNLKYSETKTRHMEKTVSDFLNSGESDKLRKKLSKKEIREERKLIKSYLKNFETLEKQNLIEWKNFDRIRKNFRVEKEEYPLLIKNAVNVINSDSYKQQLKYLKKSSHPHTLARILFLEKNIK